LHHCAAKAPWWSLFAFLALCILTAARGLAGEPQPGAAAIASAHPLATAAGHEVLSQGGNAFDAAVAVSAALGVVEPYSSGIGGGGFWLLHRARDGREVMVDGRERAPLAAHRDLYLSAEGQVVPGLSIDGALAAAIPGQAAALAHIAVRYGRLSLQQSLAPAIRLAREGFPVDAIYRDMARWRLPALRSSAAAAARFLLDGEVPPEGFLLRQPELAATLEALAQYGADGFYRGEVARKLVAAVRSAGGIWQAEDLTSYRVREREPVHGEFLGMRITSAPLPSSGGVVLLTMLNILSASDYSNVAARQRPHLLVEAMRRAYRDRAEYLGDADFVAVPVPRLLHPYYAAGLARDIDPDRATPSEPAGSAQGEGRDTTHFSILDREGNRVAATLSINYPFGSGLVAAGTGVLLNDEMDDFSVRPGTPNVYGLTGGAANAIEPGKRMLSSMTPTFVETADGVVILGTPGGSRIITMVLHAVLGIAGGQDPAVWISAPRFHHQYLPDVIQYEPGALDDQEVRLLKERGHRLEQLERPYGNMQAVVWNRSSGLLEALSDPRGGGSAVVR